MPFVFVGGPLLIADDSSVDAVDRKSELAASLRAGVMANNSAIRSCDFVFTTEYIVMHPAQVLTCQDEKCRLVYDADLQKGVLIRWIVTDTIPEEGSQRTTSNLMALYFDDTRVVRQVSAARKKSLQFPEGPSVRAMIKVPRLLSIGLVAFPDTHELVDDQNPIWESLAIPSRDTVASILSPDMARVVSKSFDDGVVRNETVWTFDLKTLMPTKRSAFYYHTKTGERHIKEIEDLQWTTCDGHHVPSRIRRETKQRVNVEGSSESVEYSQIYDTSFRWLSVNQTLSPKLLDWDLLRSTQEIRALLEP